MTRLENAQKLLAESLAALESAVQQSQQASGPPDATPNSMSGADGTAPPIDVARLSQEVAAIEADLDSAIKIITRLTAANSSGDSA